MPDLACLSPADMTPAVLLNVLGNMIAKGADAMATVERTVALMPLRTQDRAQLADCFQVLQRQATFQIEVIAGIRRWFPNLLDGAPIHGTIKRHTFAMRNNAARLRRELSVQALDADRSGFRQHYTDMIGAVAEVLDMHAEGLDELADAVRPAGAA